MRWGSSRPLESSRLWSFYGFVSSFRDINWLLPSSSTRTCNFRSTHHEGEIGIVVSHSSLLIVPLLHAARDRFSLFDARAMCRVSGVLLRFVRSFKKSRKKIRNKRYVRTNIPHLADLSFCFWKKKSWDIAFVVVQAWTGWFWDHVCRWTKMKSSSPMRVYRFRSYLIFSSALPGLFSTRALSSTDIFVHLIVVDKTYVLKRC